MRYLRSVTISMTAVALAIMTLGAQAAAADTKGTLAIVNGFPGHRVDVCLNGHEIRSRLAYGGKWLKAIVGTGTKRLRFYRPDPRRCRGKLLARKNFALGPGADLTIVLTMRAPRVVTFDNVGPLGEIPPLGAPIVTARTAYRNAADLAVNFKFRTWSPNPEYPASLAVYPLWTKGDEFITEVPPDSIHQVRTTLPESPDTIALKRVLVAASHRYEWIFVGSRPANGKFVLLDRRVSQPSA